MLNHLQEKYSKEVLPALKKEFSIENDLAVPNIKKVVVNTGFSDDKNKELMRQIQQDLMLITGQKPVIRKAKISVAGFKVREGQAVGMVVTLRGKKMWDFLTRFVGVALPRVRDFRGLKSTSFDDQGNLSIGLTDQSVFSEIIPEDSPQVFGLEVSVNVTTKEKAQGEALLRLLGFPINLEEDHA